MLILEVLEYHANQILKYHGPVEAVPLLARVTAHQLKTLGTLIHFQSPSFTDFSQKSSQKVFYC